MQEFIDLANGLADEAGTVISHYFRQGFQVDSKDDASPVTIADREVEQRLREIIEARRPEDGILGEEFGIKESRNGLTWVLDPIDGTKSFVIGRPTFGTLIALCEGDAPVLGVIDQAILKERWVGSEGGTTMNGKAVRTRQCGALKNACAASTTPAMFSAPSPLIPLPLQGGEVKEGRKPRQGEGAIKNGNPVLRKIEEKVKMLAWGGDCYMYGLLASGYMDLTVEESLSPYDFAALVPIVNGAGGKICDWDGEDLTLKSDGHVVALGDATLLEETLALLK